jgi:hypothetical protein
MDKLLAFVLCLFTWPVLLCIVLAKFCVWCVANVFEIAWYLVIAVGSLVGLGLFVAFLLLV